MNSIEGFFNNQSPISWKFFTKSEAMTPSLNGEINPIDSYNQTIRDLINEIKIRKYSVWEAENIDKVIYLLQKLELNPLMDKPRFPTKCEIWDLHVKFYSFFDIGWDRSYVPQEVDPIKLEDYINLLRKLFRD